MYVLIVDDEPGTTYALQFALHRHGILCRVANSGNEALVCVQEETPQLVLTDVNMPNGNGIFLVKEIRKMGLGIPIIMMSAQDVPLTDKERKDLNIFTTYFKPFPVEDFINEAKLILLFN